MFSVHGTETFTLKLTLEVLNWESNGGSAAEHIQERFDRYLDIKGTKGYYKKVTLRLMVRSDLNE